MTPDMKRRNLILGAAVGAAGLLIEKKAYAFENWQPPKRDASVKPTDMDYWSWVQGLYEVNRSIANLENGYWGIMARPVLQAYVENTERVNRDNTYYARGSFSKDFEAVRQRVAKTVGADPDEISLTRGATEALQVLIGGYNRLKEGDVVLYSDLDYDSMQYAMNWLKDRRGVEVKAFAIPEPATKSSVMETYRKVLSETPKAKLLLLTHLSHRTGLVMPIRDIARMARERGVDVIIDAAHSWGQIDFNVKDLDADFVGFNLHKWIGAPVGVGFFYVNRH